MSACDVLGEVKSHTRKHRDDRQDLIAAFKVGANNEHLRELREVRHVAKA